MPFQIFLKFYLQYIKKIIQIYSKIRGKNTTEGVLKNYMQREFKNIINK